MVETHRAGLALGLALLATLAGCSRAPTPDDPDAWATALPEADSERGAKLYRQVRQLGTEQLSCAICHGADGRGNYGIENPSIRSWLLERRAELTG